MRTKGSASDVAMASAAVRRRAAELLEFDAGGLTDACNQKSLEVRFNQVQWLYAGNISLLGSITIGDESLGQCLENVVSVFIVLIILFLLLYALTACGEFTFWSR